MSSLLSVGPSKEAAHAESGPNCGVSVGESGDTAVELRHGWLDTLSRRTQREAWLWRRRRKHPVPRFHRGHAGLRHTGAEVGRSVPGSPAGSAKPDQLIIDLAAGAVRTPSAEIAFDVDPASRQRLLRGLDAIAYTLDAATRIDAFEQARFAACPWARLN